LWSNSSSRNAQASRLYATYEFPRVVLFLDENSLEPSPQCRKALEAVCADPSPEAVIQFMNRFGHVYPKEVHLGGRLQAMKSLETVSGTSVTEKVEALKLEASAQFNPGFGRGTGKFQSANTDSMISNLSISGSSQMMAWEARGGDTTLSSKSALGVSIG
jgi:MAC/Perforin domain